MVGEPPIPSRIDLGRQGEAVAAKLLKQSGYRILNRNVRSRFGEIDLVAQDGQTVCFVEIRARSSVSQGWPEESVTLQKQRRLAQLARWYLKFHRLEDVPVRFDVISILFSADGTPARTRLIKGAFSASE